MKFMCREVPYIVSRGGIRKTEQFCLIFMAVQEKKEEEKKKLSQFS